MDKKISEIEQRLNGLEERLKFVFAEIEKRLDQAKPHEEYSTEERLQELEDLILLLQLESTKMKEKVGETSIDFGISISGPDIAARVSKIEEELGRGTPLESTTHPAHTHDVHPVIDEKLAALEEKIEKAHEHKLPKEMERHLKSALQEEIKDLEKRVKTLEALLEKRGKEEIEEADSDILSDVQKILKR